jgi:hypothetical protein
MIAATSRELLPVMGGGLLETIGLREARDGSPAQVVECEACVAGVSHRQTV